MGLSELMTPHQALAVNGKTFNWARRFLGQRMGSDAATLYRFCRVLDDMADGDIANGPQRLQTMRSDLISAHNTTDPLLAEFLPFIQNKNLPVNVIIALIDGLLQDQNRVRFKDLNSLLRYAYRVAGTVGLLMCYILDCEDDEACAYAIDLGIAMQLTNIARDVLEDAQMGRRYLPAGWVGNITPDEINALSYTPDDVSSQLVATAVRRLLLLADDYYKSGLSGLSYLPFRAHIAIAVAARVYREIGLKLASTGYAWYLGRQVTSMVAKLSCSILAFRSVSKRWQSTPQHKKSLHCAIKGLPYVK